jgi:ketosteroid isomerase-like protein
LTDGIAFGQVSKENVEIVRKLSDAYLRGDTAAWLGFYSPDSEIHKPSRPNQPDAVYTGPEGMRRAGAEHEDSFEDTRWERELLVDAGDRVVGLWRQHGRHKTDGTPLSTEVARVYSLLDGKVVSTRHYSSWDDALRSVRT